jgi:hypothetical protein
MKDKEGEKERWERDGEEDWREIGCVCVCEGMERKIDRGGKSPI